MRFYLQMGHGMKTMCNDLRHIWSDISLIISPQNIYPTDKLYSFADSMDKEASSFLFDPQLYTPRIYQKNLQKHKYWPQTEFTNIEIGNCTNLLRELAAINDRLQTEAFILPSCITKEIDKRWGVIQEKIAEQGRKVSPTQRTLLTIALGKDVLLDVNQIEKIIQYAELWDVDGIYLVCEHPEHSYLVNSSTWITGLLSLVAGIKRLEKEVIVGYANHQMLPLVLARCDAIASGNFLNVRWFQLDHFKTSDEKEPSRRSIWYYCPQVLSEFKITNLDVAHRSNILHSMVAPKQMLNNFSRILFEGAMPSETNYKEKDSFKHYLHCLRIQCMSARKISYKKTMDAQIDQLEKARRILQKFHTQGVKGQDRDFSEICNVNITAIQNFDEEYGFPMSQEW